MHARRAGQNVGHVLLRYPQLSAYRRIPVGEAPIIDEFHQRDNFRSRIVCILLHFHSTFRGEEWMMGKVDYSLIPSEAWIDSEKDD